MKQKKLLLIDTNSYIYRAYHALPYLSNADGLPTNAIMGFTSMLFKILREQKPDYIAAVLDSRGPSFRDRLFAEYKANRPEMPADLKVQFPYLLEIIKAMGISILQKEGFEADDLIATIIEKIKDRELNVIIVSGDKDMMQLVSEKTSILDTMKNVILDTSAVMKKFGLTPDKLPDFFSLTGDAVDNIPGVRGVGKKTAVKLLQKFGSIDGILRNLSEVKPDKIRDSIMESEEQVKINRRLVTLDRTAGIDFTQEDLKIKPPDDETLRKIFRELGFNRFLRELEPVKDEEKNFAFLREENEIDEFIKGLKNKEVGIACISSDDLNNAKNIRVISVATAPGYARSLKFSIERFLHILKNASCVHIFDLKEWFRALRINDFYSPGNTRDIRLLSYLLYPNYSNHDINSILLREFGYTLGGGEKRQNTLFVSKPANDVMTESTAILKAGRILFENLSSAGMEELYREVEMPLTKVLVDMETRGIRVQKGLLFKMESSLSKEIEDQKARIFSLAGEEFNIDSPKQLQQILFVKMKLPKKRRTKTGYSTDSDVLKELSQEHELPEKILKYRLSSKLRNTYILPLMNSINPATGRIHPTFHQDIVATGRLSCSNPNLQNIPAKGEPGEEIRRAFVPEEKMLFLSADYSQIELRLLAHFSGDRTLIEKFLSGSDIHSATAARLFNLPEDNVTPEMRRKAKVINFGVLYGMGSAGLARELNISYDEADAYIHEYFQKYPGVREYIERTIEFAKNNRYVLTISGRRRPVPDILSTDDAVRSGAERIAVNSVLQGSAADIVKTAMIRIHKRIQDEKAPVWLLLQIHDELLFEVKSEYIDVFKLWVVEFMERAASLKVPLSVKAKCGQNWAEVHD